MNVIDTVLDIPHVSVRDSQWVCGRVSRTGIYQLACLMSICLMTVCYVAMILPPLVHHKSVPVGYLQVAFGTNPLLFKNKSQRHE